MLTLLLFLSTLSLSSEPVPQLSLNAALEMARTAHPIMQAANVTLDASNAQRDGVLAGLLPHLSLSAAYQRSTANFVARPGSVPRQFGTSAPKSSLDSFNYFNMGLTFQQLIYDFGATTHKLEAANLNAQSSGANVRSQRLVVEDNVRQAYYQTLSNRALMTVAKDTLANQKKHEQQISGFVEVGTRPMVDLAAARSERATSEVSYIDAVNAYALAKAQLREAIGTMNLDDFEVIDPVPAPLANEDKSLNDLVAYAILQHPDLQAAEFQVAAAEATLNATKRSYAPSLALSSNFTDAGPAISALAWNLSGGLTFSWALFEGGLTLAQNQEAYAKWMLAKAQRDKLKLAMSRGIEQALLDVQAAKAIVLAAEEALSYAAVRLELAEARYMNGAGTLIELSDAQVGQTQSAAQKVTAYYRLAAARSLLARALGELQHD